MDGTVIIDRTSYIQESKRLLSATSLHVNIPHVDRLQAIKNVIPEKKSAFLPIRISHFVFIHNFFRCWDSLQMKGTTMGTYMPPPLQYTNVFMIDLVVSFLHICPQIPLVYLRYISDIFIIWRHGKTSLEKFCQDFNNFHPPTKLTLEYSVQKIPYVLQWRFAATRLCHYQPHLPSCHQLSL